MSEAERLSAAYDGPIPPAALAAARWGAGAWERLARGADAALIEVRLRECVAALARIRFAGMPSGSPNGAISGGIQRLVQSIAHYRRAAAAILPAG